MGSESEDVHVEDSDESLLDFKEIDDLECDIPQVAPPSLENILWDMESEASDSASLHSFQSMTNKFHSMLYHCVLQGVSSQISSAADRVNAGSPTVITNSLNYVAVGTSHGYILAFDCQQNLCWCCHDTNTIDQGAISAISFNLESTRLLVGYERGFISMIDASTGDILRRLPDAHAPQTAVLLLRFTFLSNLALCGDSSGCVFSLSFSRRLGVRSWNSKCLFSGARGEVCVFEPLVRGHDLNFLNNNVLVAMATLSKVIVISVRPKLKVYYSQQLPRISTSLPLISWQLVSVGKSFQPVLAWGRGNELHYTRVVTHGYNNNRITLLPLRKIQVPYTMNSLHWLGTRHLAILDTSENLRLVEVRNQRELEILEISNAGLVYNSAHFKALAVGGGVSEAFALAGERACYNSLSSRGDQLLVLGTRAVHMVKLRTWSERLFYLSDQGRWAEALNLATAEGSSKEKFAIPLINKYLENINLNPIDKESLTAAINCCIKLGKIDILCNELYEAISTDQSKKDWYYTLLTDQICSGSLTVLSPLIAQQLVRYLEERDCETLENVLLSLDISCLDLHQVLKICKKLKMYNAWIHITTGTLKDYTSPLTEFLCDFTPDNHKLGNILLVYVSSCLAGLGYPSGNIPDNEAARVKFDVLRCLETTHSIKCNTDEPIYPYLRALLKYNTRDCLNVVELAFSQPEFSGEMGLLQRQRLVQILMQIVKPGDFSDSQVINLSCFVARMVASNSISLDNHVLDSAIKSLTEIGNSLSIRDRSEREQAWLDLLNLNKMNHLKTSHLLKLALESKCYKVAERLYEMQGDYSSILNCYLYDPVRKYEVFSYIFKYISVSERLVREQFLVCFKDLVAISAKKTVEIVTEFFQSLLEQLCDILESDPNLQYDFLSEIVQTDLKLTSQLSEKYLEQLCVRNKSQVCNYLQSSNCRNEEALAITRKYEVHEAVAFLLESSGEWMEALELFLAHEMVDAAVSLCIRGVEHLSPEDSQSLWLKLLQTRNSISGLSLRHLLHAAAPHVPPAQMLNLVSNASFGDVRGLVQGILNDYAYDINMLTTTFKLLGKDLHLGLVKVLSSKGRGTAVSNLVCTLCQKILLYRKELDSNESFYVWNCGHCFHSACINGAEVNDACPQCRHKGAMLPKIKRLTNKEDDNTVNHQSRPDLEGHF
ncbi:vacuolar protein sorting-associated protein 8 homolog [Diabrotica undecimpunctata]|uniref:vacuolar protein sorting-associated protein 8 homolog n=1 Tax=Diabrotica undecimpunctata TaxID=50387 RepID=UPI003B64207E